MVNDWRGRTACVQVSHLCGVRGCLQTDGLTPLHVAVQACNVRVVEALAALGADVNRAMVRCFEQGRFVLSICTSSACACGYGPLSSPGCLHKFQASSTLAATLTCLLVVSFCLIWGFFLQPSGATPLYICSQNGSEDIVEALTALGAVAMSPARVGWMVGVARGVLKRSR
jgi:hypothetical protein